MKSGIKNDLEAPITETHLIVFIDDSSLVNRLRFARLPVRLVLFVKYSN